MKNNILVIGDSCTDVFVYCEANRLAPDFPIPVLNIIWQKENVGMAKNVQANIQTHLGCDIITNKNWEQVTKTRYVHNNTNHMFFRVDSTVKLDKIDLSAIQLDYDLIVISDYNKGFLTENDIEHICNKHENVFIDTKKILGPWINKARYIKINDQEYKKSLKYITQSLQNKIIHTMGGDGCEFQNKMYKVKKADVKDVSGAGDSFLAALVIKYYQTKDIYQSIKYANKCAAEVVKHRGVTLISKEESTE